MYLIHSFLLELITQPFGDDGRLEEQGGFILIIIKLVINNCCFQINKRDIAKNRRLDHFSILLRLGNVNIQLITINCALKLSYFTCYFICPIHEGVVYE